MIGIIFEFGSEIIEVRVHNEFVYFRNSSSPMFSKIDGLKLSKIGVIKEFPDLKDEPEWESKAKQRFREKILSYPTEEARADYIIKDLTKFGYIPKYMQKTGFRPVKLN